MGVYGEQVLPRIVDVACGMKASLPQRRRVCEGLAGDVVEIGSGSGHNVAFYPPARSGLDGQSLPFPDHHFDAALSTWTMCTIPDVDAALRELRRVLKPGGTLHFVEHGLAPDEDEGVRRWQHRLDPIQERVFGGCHLNRPVADLLTGAGFVITELDVYYEDGTPKVLGANSLGIAQSP